MPLKPLSPQERKKKSPEAEACTVLVAGGTLPDSKQPPPPPPSRCGLPSCVHSLLDDVVPAGIRARGQGVV